LGVTRVSPEDLSLLQGIEDAGDIKAAVKVLKDYERNPATFTTLAAYKSERQRRA